jgi:hypothetical protein
LTYEFREGSWAGPKTTIGEKLRQLHAFVLDGKLYDGDWREVFFVHAPGMWSGTVVYGSGGEIMAQVYARMEALRKGGTVILMAPLQPPP